MKRLALVLVSSTALADPDLQVHHTPVQHLNMRRKTAAVSKPAPPPKPAPAAPPPPAYPELTGVREPGQPVGFQLDVGYAIDGTQLSDHPQILGDTKSVSLGRDFAQNRAYGFADAYLSTHGIGYQPLSTYFAARFELTREQVAPDGRNGLTGETALAPPIASWFDRTNLMLRSGWGEVVANYDDIPFRVRFGQMYVYGPWVMHLQGVHGAIHHKLFDLSAYAGRRAPDYTYALLDNPEPTIVGAAMKIDLRPLTDNVPIVVAGETMRLDYPDGSPHSTHLQGEIDWRPTRETVVLGQARTIDGNLANEHVQLRTRYKQITNLVIDFQHRHATDWQWDPSLVGQPTDASEARRYLDMGLVQPQLLTSIRAGTVLFDNVDVLGRAAYARDLVTQEQDKESTNASYLELAGALEVRLRRTVSLGASILRRKNERPTNTMPIPDVPGPQPLPGELYTGLDDFTEIGLTARLSLGARRFSGTFEIYGRKTQYTQPYCTANDVGMCTSLLSPGFATSDIRGGGRITIDAYVGKRLRLFAAYDLSSTFDFAPEITGYKSLRLVMEGVY